MSLARLVTRATFTPGPSSSSKRVTVGPTVWPDAAGSPRRGRPARSTRARPAAADLGPVELLGLRPRQQLHGRAAATRRVAAEAVHRQRAGLGALAASTRRAARLDVGHDVGAGIGLGLGRDDLGLGRATAGSGAERRRRGRRAPGRRPRRRRRRRRRRRSARARRRRPRRRSSASSVVVGAVRDRACHSSRTGAADAGQRGAQRHAGEQHQGQRDERRGARPRHPSRRGPSAGGCRRRRRCTPPAPAAGADEAARRGRPPARSARPATEASASASPTPARAGSWLRAPGDEHDPGRRRRPGGRGSGRPRARCPSRGARRGPTGPERVDVERRARRGSPTVTRPMPQTSSTWPSSTDSAEASHRADAGPRARRRGGGAGRRRGACEPGAGFAPAFGLAPASAGRRPGGGACARPGGASSSPQWPQR